MSFAEPAAATDAERILQAIETMSERQDNFADAINGLGANMQWIVDNVKNLFEMIGNPKFMSMLPNMMNPEGMQAAAEEMKTKEVAPE
jgi:hypothetical protein